MRNQNYGGGEASPVSGAGAAVSQVSLAPPLVPLVPGAGSPAGGEGGDTQQQQQASLLSLQQTNSALRAFGESMCCFSHLIEMGICF